MASNEGNTKLRALKRESDNTEDLNTWRKWWNQLVGRPPKRVAQVLGPIGVLAAAMAVVLQPPPWDANGLQRALGLLMLNGLVMSVLWRFWFRQLEFRMGYSGIKDLVFLATLILAAALFARGHLLFSKSLVQGVAGIGLLPLSFGAPLSFGVLLAALFLGPRAGMVLAVFNAFVASLFWSGSATVLVFFLVCGVVAANSIRKEHTRAAMLKAGGWSALAGAGVVLFVALAQGWALTLDLGVAVLATALGCTVSGVLAAGLAPFCEYCFGYTTDVKLLEQASLDHPALGELMIKAPGTYHHSLIVGSLVEAAAREIGANHLLARVAALYHDIGKTKKPAYFVENQMGSPNRHEKLAPSMSALILISHLKEGVELARRYRLGQPIIDIMAQHHGTRVIQYFYQKAKAARLAAGQDEPDPEAFRYPGPRPQTREAGLVMLADTVEAAARSLDNPTPARIQGLVATQINKIFAEGQLEECELTLKDLHAIAKVFNTILTGIFHQRVEYPGQDKAKRGNGDSDRQPATDGADRSAQPREEDAPGLKRLGLK
jgi:putative nucleotidyltransferase with HDIG domain